MAEAARLFPVDEDDANDAPVAGAMVQDNAPEGAVLKDARSPRSAEMLEAIRIAEALIFAAESPIEESEIAKRIPDGLKVADVMREAKADYEGRGVNLVRIGKKWIFRTATDLGWLLSRETQQQKKLSRAALETLAIVAYHQPVTRAEIEDIRGVAISKGTIDVLMETGWVRLRGRRKAPGRPVTYGTTDDFLLHFNLEGITDLPGLDELKGAGLFDGRLPAGFGVPTPNDSSDLTEDEEPLEESDLLSLAAGGDVPETEGDEEAEGEAEDAAAEAVVVEPVAEMAGEPAGLSALESEGEVADAARAGVESLDHSSGNRDEAIEAAMEAHAEASFAEPQGEDTAALDAEGADESASGDAAASEEGSSAPPDTDDSGDLPR